MPVITQNIGPCECCGGGGCQCTAQALRFLVQFPGVVGSAPQTEQCCSVLSGQVHELNFVLQCLWRCGDPFDPIIGCGIACYTSAAKIDLKYLGNFRIEVTVYDPIIADPGAAARYELIDPTWDCASPRTLNRVMPATAGDGYFCKNWPDTITIVPA